jgi:hypothetical protein
LEYPFGQKAKIGRSGSIQPRATRPKRLRRVWGKSSFWWGETGHLQRFSEVVDTYNIEAAKEGATEVLQDDGWRSGKFGSSMTMIAVGAGGFFFKWHRETTCGLCCR